MDPTGMQEFFMRKKEEDLRIYEKFSFFLKKNYYSPLVFCRSSCIIPLKKELKK